ncbi:MAG: hypothetical protein ACOZF0_00950 [Thermodesulfobacteriota bacterium]
MTPVYFPFTAISPEKAALLASCFDRIAVYRPATPKDGENNPAGVEIRVPIHQDEERFENLYKSFREWGLLHRPEDFSILKPMHQDTVRLINEETVSQIRSSLGQHGQSEANEKEDVLLQARVFLQLAREFDRQQEEIGKGMQTAEWLERKMVCGLLGNAAPESAAAGSAACDPGAYMTRQRLAAWSCLLNRDTRNPVLFLTDSRAVLDYLLENASAMKPVATVSIKPPEAEPTQPECHQRQAIREILQRFLNTPSDAPVEEVSLPTSMPQDEEWIKMELFRIAGTDPQHFFKQFTGPYAVEETPSENPQPFSATLIGFITMERAF